MASNHKRTTGKQSTGSGPWFRLLQTLGKNRSSGQADSGTEQQTFGVSGKTVEELEEEVMRTYVPPCSKKVRKAVINHINDTPYPNLRFLLRKS